MAEGWVKLHRSMLDSPIFSNAELLRLWVYLLMHAAHTEADIMVGNQMIHLKPGQLVTGRKKISRDLGLDESKIRRLINKLELAENVTITPTNKFTLVTIANWDFFQGREEKATSKTADNRPTNDQQMTTNKNEKNYKKSFSPDGEAYRCALFLAKNIHQRLPKSKPTTEATLQKWADQMDKLHRLDGYSWETIAEVLDFSQRDEFWGTVILSAGKFRKQFTQLMARLEGVRQNAS